MPRPVGSAPPRGSAARAYTWPPPDSADVHIVHAGPEAFNTSSLDPYASERFDANRHPRDSFREPALVADDEVDADPEKHFLSPVHMYEYEDWAEEDSEDEAAEVEWDAGITDFALFDDDRRHAQESGASLPHRWVDLMSNQLSALERSEQRSRRDPPRQPATRRLLLGDSDAIPDLTPDNSPDLRDDLDEAEHSPPQHRRAATRDRPRITVTSPQGHTHKSLIELDGDDNDNDHDDLLFSLFQAQNDPLLRPRRRTAPLQRPGLRQSRTLSGHAHVWRRPSWQISPVGEDREGEVSAERNEARGRAGR